MPIYMTRIRYLIRRAATDITFTDKKHLLVVLLDQVTDAAFYLTSDQTDRQMIAQSLSGN